MALKFNLKKILVPTDFSARAMGALHYAAAMAKHSDAEIVLLHVVEQYEHNTDLGQVIDLTETLRKAIQDKLIEIKNENMDLWGIKISVEVASGKIYKQIYRTLQNKDIDLVVMGTHGSSGIDSFEKFILGSNAYRIVRMAQCPVITVRHAREEVSFKKVVLPLDTTKETKDKVASAIKIARVFGATIHLVGVSSRFEELRLGAEKLQDQLEDVAWSIQDAGVPVVTEYLKSENVVKAINNYAKKIEADLIMIMTAEESAIAEFALGSSARKIITESHIPVMSIKPGYQ